MFQNATSLYLAFRKQLYLFSKNRFLLKKTGCAIFLMDIYNHIDRQIEAFGAYESDRYDFLSDLMAKNCCKYFIDVGAHWGLYSINLGLDDNFKDVKIFAFEPDKNNRYQFYGNLFLNSLCDRIQVSSKGVSDLIGDIKFEPYDRENRGRSRISEAGTKIIETTTLDNELRLIDESIGIKIDVEGHELHAIRGMKNLLGNNNCFLQIEAFGKNADELRTLMMSLGYTMINSIENDFYFCRAS